MYKQQQITGLTYARGGSKGLPGKNLRLLRGKPLIGWTLEAAQKSSVMDGIILSTEDATIMQVGTEFGAEVPFQRPASLADDQTTGTDVALHALQWLVEQNRKPDILVVLQPTSPLRTAEDIDRAVERMVDQNIASMVSVCEVDHHPFFSAPLESDGKMTQFLRQDKGQNRQDLPVYYRQNGAIYLIRSDLFLAKRCLLTDETVAFIMDREHSVDIDSELDFLVAEKLMEQGSWY